MRARLADLYATSTANWEHLASYTIDGALPAMPVPLRLSQPCRVTEDGTGPGRAGLGSTSLGGPRRYVRGDHRATGSVQGALASGARAARELRADC